MKLKSLLVAIILVLCCILSVSCTTGGGSNLSPNATDNTQEVLTDDTTYGDDESVNDDKIDPPVLGGTKSPNIVNPNTVIENSYVNYLTGRVEAATGFCATPFIETEDHSKLFSNKNYSDGRTQTAFYDKNLNYISGVKDVTESGVTLPSGAAFVRITFRASNTDMMFSFDRSYSYIPYGAYVELEEKQEQKTNVLTVKLDGTGDFDNLRKCFESIKNASEKNPYTVEIYEGTYDIRSYYTDEEWSVEKGTFNGLFIPNYVTLRGIGRKEKIVLTAADTKDRRYISTLNMKDTCGLENVTVKAENLRYVIHDDYASKNANGYTRHVENCDFIGVSLTLGNAYGAGLNQGAKVTFKNCTFQSANGFGVTYHNNVNWDIPSYVTFENCSFGKGARLGTLNTNANDMLTYVTFVGCKGDLLKLFEENANLYGSGILFKVTGSANDFTKTEIIATDGVDYSKNVDFT